MLRCLLTPRNNLIQHVQRCEVAFVKSTLVAGWSRGRCFAQSRVLSSTPDHNDAIKKREVSGGTRSGRTKAVHDYAFLISERNARSASPKLQTPHDIKAFYRAIQTKGLLQDLSPEESSSTIQLFASLSLLPDPSDDSPIPDDNMSGNFAFHPLAPVLSKHQTSGTRQHWSFVLMVAKDKLSCGLTLAESDNYWLMRAAIEDAKRMLDEGPKGRAVEHCLQRARNYYMRIRHIKDEPFVHKVYLTALLDYGGHTSVDEVITHLGNLLSWSGGLYSDLQSIFWRAVAHSGSISSATKGRFLQILRKKLSKVRDILPKPSRSTESSSSPSPDPESSLYDALAIRNYFVDVIFSFKPGTRQSLHYLRDIYPWVLFESRAALCAFNDGTYASLEEEDRAAWSNLILLSLSYTAARKESGAGTTNVAPRQGLDGGIQSQAQVLGWTVICSIAALSSEFHLRSHFRKRIDPSSAEGIQEIARTLWVLWRKEEAWRAGAMMRPTSLICSVVTSFMALAAISGDSRLAISLVRHISDAVIYPAQLGEETLDRNMLRACAVHFAILIATKGVGGPPRTTWDEILAALRYAQLIPDGMDPASMRWSSAVAKTMLLELAQLDALLSHRLLVSSHEYGLTMDDDVLFSIGKALVFAGHLNIALELLRDSRLSMSSASLLLDSLLSNVLRHGDWHPELIQSFVKIFTDTSIRPTNSQALEPFLRTCIQIGYLKQAIEIAARVHESDPSLLRSQFLTNFASTLISHRHYKLLGKVLKDAWHKTPDSRASILRGSRLQYIGRLLTRHPKASNREVARSLPFSIYVWPVLRDHIPFHPRLARLNKKTMSLKLSSQLQKSGKLDEKTLERAVHLLVDAGRVTSALKLLSKHSPIISTKAGNIILSDSLRPKPSRRQKRQLRHASSRLAQLVEERGFVPDRVTLNLLMKALLRWKNITPKATLRALFDRLTMSGYPVPEDMLNAGSASTSKTNTSSTIGRNKSPPPVSRTLFGTDTSPGAKKESLQIDLKAFPKGVSFARHTRPLYKMFVKAFKGRGDKEAARRVATALKSLKEETIRERAVRDEARRLGRIKARERLKRQAKTRDENG